jgi:hypothetical protein
MRPQRLRRLPRLPRSANFDTLLASRDGVTLPIFIPAPGRYPMQKSQDPLWDQLTNHEVVLDLASHYVVLGRLVAVRVEFLELERADAHDLRDSQTTREKYVLDCRLHGIRPNRERTWISLREIVGISRLADVLVD